MAWHQWLNNQSKSASKEHYKAKREVWNELVEEAVHNNNTLALRLIREPQELAKDYITDK